VSTHIDKISPIREDGKWGAKCRKVYDLDGQGQGQRIPDGKGGWKSHREATTDWNQRGNAEKWRAAWASYANRALEAAGRPERIDHRSYKRQDTAPTSQYAKVKTLKEDAKLFNFLMENGISSMEQLYEKVSAMNSGYYDLRGKIVKAERRLSVLNARLEMWTQYQKYKPIRQKLDKVSPGKREQFEQRHSADLALFDAAARYLDTLKASGEAITPRAWRAEVKKLTAEKDADYLKMRDMWEDIKAVETLKRTAECLAREGQTQRREEQER